MCGRCKNLFYKAHALIGSGFTVVVMAATNKDVVLVISLVLSLVSLVLLFGVTWYFQSSLDQLQQQVEYDRELLLKLQEQVNVREMEKYVCGTYAVTTCNMCE